jgi:hypothetical protein
MREFQKRKWITLAQLPRSYTETKVNVDLSWGLSLQRRPMLLYWSLGYLIYM